VHAREARRQHQGRQLGFTREQIRALRAKVLRRPRVTKIEETGHRGAESHDVPNEVVLQTINNPQKVFVARNGNWIFYRNGTIVVTQGGNLSSYITAFGRGGKVPQRRVGDIRRLYNDPNVKAGDSELPIRLAEWMAQQLGDFQVFPVWP
jgi:hypothetical protein